MKETVEENRFKILNSDFGMIYKLRKKKLLIQVSKFVD